MQIPTIYENPDKTLTKQYSDVLKFCLTQNPNKSKISVI